jgi:hypothetical protein
MHVVKFMPCYNGPYEVTDTASEISTVTINLPNYPNSFPTFHTSQVRPFVENDKNLFPAHQLDEPVSIYVDDQEEFYIDHILDEHKQSRGVQYLIWWAGYGPKEDRWLPRHELADCEALDIWLAKTDLVASM